MSNQPIEYDLKGIKCDNPSCGWQDLEVEFIPEVWLNKPCPDCGSNLFSDEAFEQMKAMKQMFDAINDAMADIDLSNEERVEVTLTHDEKGLVDGMKILDKEDV